MKEEDIKILIDVIKEMRSQLNGEYSLLLDIYGMAFYRNTGIFPPFKSAPVEVEQSQESHEERSKAYDEWIKKLNELLTPTLTKRE